MMLAEVSLKVSVNVLAMLSKKRIGGSIGNTFLMKYRYWQYFLKVLLTTLFKCVSTPGPKSYGYDTALGLVKTFLISAVVLCKPLIM